MDSGRQGQGVGRQETGLEAPLPAAHGNMEMEHHQETTDGMRPFHTSCEPQCSCPPPPPPPLLPTEADALVLRTERVGHAPVQAGRVRVVPQRLLKQRQRLGLRGDG